jgi:hypothetical protein
MSLARSCKADARRSQSPLKRRLTQTTADWEIAHQMQLTLKMKDLQGRVKYSSKRHVK